MTTRLLTSSVFIAAVLFLSEAAAQTTQAWLVGRVLDSISGRPVPGASVRCESAGNGSSFPAVTSADGRFVFAALTPGRYKVTIQADQYQAQQLRQLDLPVAGRLELEFHLRPLNDLWEAGRYQSYLVPGSTQLLDFYGPDVDSTRVATFEANHGKTTNLEASVSTVIDQATLDALPLLGRDLYSFLVLLPGVTADTATGRGLGFSVNGQRPSSSNYLLDGLENNNLSVTGPLGAIAPEPVQEYRISTSNFSAEYGRTSGFLANAISKAGSNVWHGSAFLHLKNERLDANGFQENTNGIARAPLTEVQPGGGMAGPILKNRLFFSGSLELERYRSLNDPQTYWLPTQQFINGTTASSWAGALLREYPAAVTPAGTGDSAPVSIPAPAQLDQALGLTRLDYVSPHGGSKVFVRTQVSGLREPDLVYNPYPQFSSPYHQGETSLGLGWTLQLGATVTQELRAGRTGDSSRFDRPHSETPVLSGPTDPATGQSVYLPGSRSTFGYRDLTQNWEVADNWSWLIGRHTVKLGGGAFWRGIQSAFTADRDGLYFFSNLDSFAAGSPSFFDRAYDRTNPFQPVPYNRTYRYLQTDFFIQDAFRVTSRLSVSYGLRYDHLGAPVNTGAAKDSLIELGSGSTFPQRLAGASFAPLPSANQRVFSVRGGSWGPRLGITYDLTGNGTTLLRASYGIFYDRPFDNLWQTVPINRQLYGQATIDGPMVNPFPPPAPTEYHGQYHLPFLFQPDLKIPMVQSAFAGIQRRLADGFTIEENLLSSRGRQLWTTDTVNRNDAVFGADNPNLGTIYYRGNQGNSDYYALASTLRFHRQRWSGQMSYTWSHSIDNQSDPLAGIFEDYNLFKNPNFPNLQLAAFSGQFASQADRANSDFDQRHNLVFFGFYQLPSPRGKLQVLLRDWRIAGLGAVRSGLPFSVYAPQDFADLTGAGAYIDNQRADLLNPDAARLSPAPAVAGGKRLLNFSAFGTPPGDVIGNTGRNAFAGPGLISADLSLARSFSIRKLSEGAKLTLRADAFNFLNHANLNNPDPQLGAGAAMFGQALYGRREQNSGFPGLTPLNETSRQFQLFVRLDL